MGRRRGRADSPDVIRHLVILRYVETVSAAMACLIPAVAALLAVLLR